MQLVAYGAQDVYLTGNPQITFFKTVYRRHTNFSMESIIQTFDGNADFGNKVTATIARNGDLIHRMYLEHDAVFTATKGATTSNVALAEHYGHSLIKECEIEIGGQRIDKHYAMWNRVWSDLTEYNPSGHFGAAVVPSNGGAPQSGTGTLYQYMTGNGYSVNTGASTADNEYGIDNGNTVNGFTATVGGTSSTVEGKMTVNKIFLPLHFWFCRNPGLSLPLIALQYHEVKVVMHFEERKNLVRSCADDGQSNPGLHTEFVGTTTSKNFDLYCDYIYLDTDERRRFAQVSHEYLIEQVQRQEFTITSVNDTLDINLNHPVKEMIWATRNEGTSGRNGPSNDGAAGTDPTASVVSLDQMWGTWQLKLNGQDRFKERDTRYFTRTQVWQHHTGYGAVYTLGDNDSDLEADDTTPHGGDSIAVYSFALKPEEHQPSGTCNFSRIDSAQLVGTDLRISDDDGATQNEPALNTNVVNLTLFAVNYNVLRIMSGMGGLAYSN